MIRKEIINGKALKLNLKADLVRTLLRGHAWVYQNALKPHTPGFAGQRVKLFDRTGKKFIGEGYYDPQSPIRVRMCTTSSQSLIQHTMEDRLLQAFQTRKASFSASNTNAYRLVNGPGDGLPGLVIDRYANTAVLKLDGAGAEAFWDVKKIAEILIAKTDVNSIFQRFKDKKQVSGKFIYGKESKEEVEILENGLKFLVNFKKGQKTGFFLDQRENRKRIQAFSANASVLNVFGYTGGFSVYAGAAGAKQVATVDLAQPALDLADRNWQINNLPPEKHTSIKADAIQYLEEQKQSTISWDMVILDPPSYAHAEGHLKQGLNAYTKLIAAGASITSHNGILCAASCSSHVSMDAFLECCENGVGKARKTAKILGIYGQPDDHPSPLVMPELRYLKFVIMKITP